MKRELDAAKQRIEKLTADLAAAEERIEQLAAGKAAAEARLAEVSNQKAAGETRIAELTTRLAQAEERVAQLSAEGALAATRLAEQQAALSETQQMLTELGKENELQAGDLRRVKEALLEGAPNCPERVPHGSLQFALASVLDEATERPEPEAPFALELEDATGAPSPEQLRDAKEVLRRQAELTERLRKARAKRKPRRRAPGESWLANAKLPTYTIPLDPPEVTERDGVGFELIGVEPVACIAHQRASYIRLLVLKRRYKAKKAERLEALAATEPTAAPVEPEVTSSNEFADGTPVPAVPSRPQLLRCSAFSATPVLTLAALAGAVPEDLGAPASIALEAQTANARTPMLPVVPGRIYQAEVPDWLWPRFIADPSAIAHSIISKYADTIPLHRQERMRARDGVRIARSTVCGWFDAAYGYLRHIVEAMFDEAKRTAPLIAGDATGVSVRVPGGSERWHIFVFIAGGDHVIYRYSRHHSSEAITSMLEGFRGKLLVDAAVIYDVLFEEHGVIEVGCWAHVRRYFWKALQTQPKLALEGLSMINQLFAIEQRIAHLSPEQRVRERAGTSAPILLVFDDWVQKSRALADARGPLARAFTYYKNQRSALHRFLEDGTLPIHNNRSEGSLRSVALGRDAWFAYDKETGLKWDTVFRSLIASAVLHDLNPEQYLEEVLRLVPHWPVNRVLELAPNHWTATRAKLTERQLATINPPWKELVRASLGSAAA